MPIWEGRKSGHVRIFLFLASLYADMNVRLRSAMLAPAGGGVVSREHDQKPVQVQWLFFILGSCYLGKLFVEEEGGSTKSYCTESVGCSVSVSHLPSKVFTFV